MLLDLADFITDKYSKHFVVTDIFETSSSVAKLKKLRLF